MESSFPHTGPFTDESAWQALHQGNKCAFEYLYHKYVDILYDYGNKLSPSRDLAEDCIQELFADIWQKRVRMTAVKSTKHYLLIALKRRIIRALAARKEYPFLPDYTFDVVIANHAGFANQHIPEEKVEQLKKAFVKLTSKQKEVVYLRYYNQLGYEEIAEIMDVHVKAVYKLLYRSLDALRKHVPKETYLWSLLF